MNESKGIPVYLDRTKRKFADLAAEKIDVTDWHPSNTPAQNLWRCFEALQDIKNLLQGSSILSSEDERRRRVKILITPLYSLCLAIRDLLNYLNSGIEMKSRFNKKERAKINKLLSEFSRVVPLDQTSAIRGIRDQLSAHIDKLMPYEAQSIFDKAQNHEVGAWLHQCIITLNQVLTLDVFGWTTDDCPEGYFRLMAIEPWLVKWKLENGEPSIFAGVHIADSPKKLIREAYEQIIRSSQWMFRPEDSRIVLLQEKATETSKPLQQHNH
ncbi:hypothetical protein [Nostoc sp. PCC 7107]|uniref:hypothetical protein n=1 Tax=Nostoc sp. PCC 7107 TaxID=317936 RepID=UPI00029F4152|nr:hypothetical protein [Nostoc sp. PCC 7107]AFY43575.1 hypothetical protein Nos7107_2980 [Nostoc sp. PCC 7107]